MNTPLKQTLVGYVSHWRWGSEGGCRAHVSLNGPHDMTLWTVEYVAQPHWGQSRCLRLEGYALGHWFIATAITEPNKVTR
jgi:hypothetical protein